VVIAINVTGDPAVYAETRGCKVIEIIVEVPEVENLDTEHLHELYNQYYQAGYDAVFDAL
jgi:hypothetical protein